MMIYFIVPAHNEEALIAATIASLHRAAAACGEYQIIVAADACTDRTAEIAVQAGAAVVPVALRQISAVRNAGAREALRRSSSPDDVLVFVDADTQVPEETLKASMDALRAGAIGGGAGVEFDGEVPFLVGQATTLLVFAFRVLKLSGGCYIFCTRRAFVATGGWDEGVFAGEEIYMCGALKRQGRFAVGHQRVITSGRKLRDYSAGEIFGTMARLALKGRRAVSSRDGLDLWYGTGLRAASGGEPGSGAAARPTSGQRTP